LFPNAVPRNVCSTVTTAVRRDVTYGIGKTRATLRDRSATTAYENGQNRTLAYKKSRAFSFPRVILSITLPFFRRVMGVETVITRPRVSSTGFFETREDVRRERPAGAKNRIKQRFCCFSDAGSTTRAIRLRRYLFRLLNYCVHTVRTWHANPKDKDNDNKNVLCSNLKLDTEREKERERGTVYFFMK